MMDKEEWFWGCEEAEREAFEKIKACEYEDFSMKWEGGKSFADIYLLCCDECFAYIEMKIRNSIPLSVLKARDWPFFWPKRNEDSNFFHEFERNKDLLDKRHWNDALCCCIQKGEDIFYLTKVESVAKSKVKIIDNTSSKVGGICHTYQVSAECWKEFQPTDLLKGALSLLGVV